MYEFYMFGAPKCLPALYERPSDMITTWIVRYIVECVEYL
jgi:hypothetical protein